MGSALKLYTIKGMIVKMMNIVYIAIYVFLTILFTAFEWVEKVLVLQNIITTIVNTIVLHGNKLIIVVVFAISDE